MKEPCNRGYLFFKILTAKELSGTDGESFT
jgi:hypothetical protein